MYSEEETELRDLILQNLESCGFLNKIKAELRAGVFLALEDDGNLKSKIPLFNKKCDEFASTNNGKILLSIIREFLEYFNLHFTLSVFDPEIAVSSACIPRSELCKQLNINSDIDGPVLSELIKDKIKDENKNPSHIGTQELQPEGNKALRSTKGESIPDENVSAINENFAYEKKTSILNNLKKEYNASRSADNDAKEILFDTNIFSKADSEVSNNIFTEKQITDTAQEIKTAKVGDIFKETNDILTSDHDPFFDEPLPSEKPSLFDFADTFKDKSEEKLLSDVKRDSDESRKTSLASLKDLPSLTSNNEWTFSKDPKNLFPSLDSQKSVSSSEASNEEIINLDSRENFQKKDSDVTESNEESNGKQNSEESIEEDIEDDSMSAGLDDILNSSMSLAEDNTTDQTVSQISIVEGVDHIEPCK